MRYILVLLLLTACAHRDPLDNEVQETKDKLQVEHINELRKKVRDLEDQQSSNMFMIELDRCFIDLLMCERGKKTQCWERHEQCAINVHRMYKARSKTN